MKTKKLLSLLLAVLMLLSVMPISAYALSGNVALSDGGALKGSYYLSQDITLSKDITVAKGKTLNLYLNDYVLNLNGHRIIVDGTLNLYDTFEGSTKALTTRYFTEGNMDGCYENYSAAASDGAIAVVGGVITGGDLISTKDKEGGAVYNNGTFNMYAGNIVGNKTASSYDNSAEGGGVHNNGSFTMNGGMISGNLVYGQTTTEADNAGGGVFNEKNATFTMTAGTISYNTAAGDGENTVEDCYGFGGGIDNEGTFNISGGTVSNNTSDKAGAGVNTSSGITVGGTAVITSNKNKNDTVSNVYLTNGALITPENYTGTCGVKKYGTTGVFSTATESKYVSNFTSDNENYGIRFNENNALEITDTFAVAVSASSHGTVTANKANAKAGDTVTLTQTPDSGYALIGCTVTRKDNGEAVTVTDNAFTMPASDVTVKATFAVPQSYAITYGTTAHGTVTGAQSAVCGETVTLSSTADKGYSRKSYTVYKTGDKGTTVAVTNGKFIMPAYPVTVTAEFGEYTHDYLTFTSEAPFTVTPNVYHGLDTIEYSTDKVNWYKVGSSPKAVSSSQSAPYVLYFRGNGGSEYYGISQHGDDYAWQLTPSSGCKIAASGNIMTLLDYENPDDVTMADFAFAYMFYRCQSLTSAPELPATTLSKYCYVDMFLGCSYLTSAPELPATTLADFCYNCMFDACDGLVTAPELPATTLATSCYSTMFANCDSLVTAPELPATTLAKNCYLNMFDGCDSLVTAPELPATTLASWCYSGMFSYCTSLIKAPELPATTLAEGCYFIMFEGCTRMHLYEQGYGEYFEIPEDAENSAYLDNSKMFANTTGDFTGVPVPGKKYYYSAVDESQYYDTDYLKFSSDTPFTITSPNKDGVSFEYSYDKLIWFSLGKGQRVKSYNGVIYLRGTEQYKAYGIWEISGSNVYASGNIMTLLDYKDPDNAVMAESAFDSMFAQCTALVSAPDLPATTLAKYCYREMFYGCTSLTTAPFIASVNAEKCCENMFYKCSKLKVTTEKPASGSYLAWYFDDVRSTEEEDWSSDESIEHFMEYGEPLKITKTSLDDMLKGTASGFDTPAANTVYYLLTNDGNGNYSYNTADTVTVNDSLSKATVGYTGTKLVVEPNTPSNYTLKSITASTDSTAETDITSAKKLACAKGESAAVTVASLPIYDVDKEIVTDEGITASESKVQSYVDKYKLDATADTTYKLTVKAQTPESTAKTAVEALAGVSDTRTVAFFDANYTKTIGTTTTEITDTGDNILSFTIPYDMTGLCELAVYRYHNAAETLTRVYTTANAKDGTYYVEGSGADTKVTVFASKFSAYALGATEIPADVENVGYSASLTLNKNIDINFKMSDFGSGFDDDLLTITVDGAVWDDYEIADGVLSGVLKAVEPRDIGTDLHIVIVYDGVTVKDFTYSVKAYCEAVFNANTDGQYNELAALCEALLNYGKYAADYANGNTASTLNEGHEADFGKDYEFTGLQDKNVTRGNYADEGTGAYLELGSTIKLHFTLKNCSVALDNASELTQNFFVLDDKATPEQIDPARVTISPLGNGNYDVSVDLYASQLATSYTLKLLDVDKSEFCITYGVYNYCNDIQSITNSDTLKKLCKAIHNYGEAVRAYEDAE